MSLITTLAELDQYEDRLIQSFQQHPCFQQIQSLPREQFHLLLLQRRFLSLAFTPVYDMVIDGIKESKARQSARRILREEYPDRRGNVPSHREDLVSDLLNLGIHYNQIINCTPSAQTLGVLQKTFALLAGNIVDDLYQIKLLTILRFWGEVLVSAEYTMLWERIHTMGLTTSGEKRSLFYHLHMVHDAKKKSLIHLSLIGSTHSDLLAVSLKTLLQDESSLSYCAKIEDEILAIKNEFYNQFI